MIGHLLPHCVLVTPHYISIGSDYGKVPNWHQAIAWTSGSGDILKVGLLEAMFSEIDTNIFIVKMSKKISYTKCYPLCSGLNVLVRVARLSLMPFYPLAFQAEGLLSLPASVCLSVRENDGNFGEVIKGTDIRLDTTHLSLYMCMKYLCKRPLGLGFVQATGAH